MNDTTFFKIGSNEWLACIEPKSGEVKTSERTAVDHIFAIDVSYSMANVLPDLRKQMRSMLPEVCRDGDTVSIIWFSGKGECGALCERHSVSTPADLQKLSTLIDAWIKPVGATGFLDPLKLAAQISQGAPAGRFASFVFLSDGYDNCSARNDVMTVCKQLSGLLNSCAVIEFGFYADHQFLQQMAETIGGALLMAKDIGSYSQQLNAYATRSLRVPPREVSEIESDLKLVGDFVYAVADTGPLVYAVGADRRVSAPAGVKLWAVVNELPANAKVVTPVFGPGVSTETQAAMYAGVCAFAQKSKSTVTRSLAYALGDVQVIEDYAACFGKQSYARFIERVTAMIRQETQRYRRGHNPNCAPNPNQLTVVEFLEMVADDEKTLVCLQHEEWEYNRISMKRVASDDAKQAALAAADAMLDAQMRFGVNSKEAKDAAAAYAAVGDSHIPVFTPTINVAGVEIDDLIYHSSRPNVSFRVRIDGTLDVSQIPGRPSSVEPVVQTFVYRTYSAVADGVINIKKLPLQMSTALRNKLAREVLPENFIRYDAQGIAIVNLDLLPLTNAKSVQEVNSQDLTVAEWRLARAKGRQKVLNHYMRVYGRSSDRRSQSLLSVYGDAGAAFLRDYGVTDAGYHPTATESAPSGDFYMSKGLVTKIKGMSSLPSIDEVVGKLADSKKKLTISASTMAPEIQRMEKELASDVYKKAVDPKAYFASKIEGELKALRSEVREASAKIAKIKYAMVVSQTWFNDRRDITDNVVTMNVDGQDVVATYELEEKEVHI